MSAPPLRWGVLAAGGIARKFADNVSRFTSGAVVAVGSRGARARPAGSPTSSTCPSRTAATRRWSPTRPCRPCTSRARTPSTATTRCWRSRQASTCWSRSRSRSTRPRRPRCSTPRAAPGCSSWRRCGPGTCRTSRRCTASSRAARSARWYSVIADHGQNMGQLPPTHRMHALGPRRRRAAGPRRLPGLLRPRPARCAGPHPGDRLAHATGVDGQIAMALGYGERAQAACTPRCGPGPPTTAVIAGHGGADRGRGQVLRPDVVLGAARRRHLVGLRPADRGRPVRAVASSTRRPRWPDGSRRARPRARG